MTQDDRKLVYDEQRGHGRKGTCLDALRGDQALNRSYDGVIGCVFLACLEEREGVVASLRDSGMSTRAIASATGVSRPTVIKDLNRQVDNSLPPAADPLEIDTRGG